MCILLHGVEDIGDTKIFVAPNAKQTKQITVFKNFIKNGAPNNAIILPCPYPETIEFISLENFKKFFTTCEKLFLMAPETLFVQQLGSYIATVVPSISDFSKLDEKFVVTQDCLNLLRDEYFGKNMGFIVCQLMEGAQNYHPFGYSHKLPPKLFLPTKHYNGERKAFEKFNHNIYVYNGICMSDLNYKISLYTRTAENYLELFEIGKCHTFYKYRISGVFRNTDIEVPIFKPCEETKKSSWWWCF